MQRHPPGGAKEAQHQHSCLFEGRLREHSLLPEAQAAELLPAHPQLSWFHQLLLQADGLIPGASLLLKDTSRLL